MDRLSVHALLRTRSEIPSKYINTNKIKHQQKGTYILTNKFYDTS